MKKSVHVSLGLLALWGVCLHAAESRLPSAGIADRPNAAIALTNARVVTEPGKVLERATILLRDGKIEAVGTSLRVPSDAAPLDLQGKTVFPGFIDAGTSLGVPGGLRRGGIASADRNAPPPHDQTAAQPGFPHWNRRVRPEQQVSAVFEANGDAVRALRSVGLTAVQSVPEAGVFAGQSALISLLDSPDKRDLMLKDAVAQVIALDFQFGQEYPGSLMGVIALIRQTWLDASAYSAEFTPRGQISESLAALQAATHGKQTTLFVLDDELDMARMQAVANEFSLAPVYLGTGYEYRILPQVKQAAAPIIVPLKTPDAPLIDSAEAMASVSLAELQHWEQAPANPARLAQEGVPFALSTRGMDSVEKSFYPALRRAVAAGLTEQDALRALTITPASIVGESKRLGRIAPGYLANLVIADADLFTASSAKVYAVYVEGQRSELNRIGAPNLAGDWVATWSEGTSPETWQIRTKGDTLEVQGDATTWILKAQDGVYLGLPKGYRDAVRLQLTDVAGRLIGHVEQADGRRVEFVAQRAASAAGETKPTGEADLPSAIPSFQGYPAGEFGLSGPPEQAASVLFRNATVWTNSELGVATETDVLVKQGRIAQVGKALKAPRDAVVIDASGMHLTSGIIDAHSHTAVARNINEPSHAVTSEVRIGDVIDPTDINLYWQLAGGVTTANLLHGSANPMGGQNAVIKLRWGEDANGLRMQGAPSGIKFALGENVKQSGWGPAFVTRYPQTRMGVEQIMREHFNMARAYNDALARGEKPRRDLRIEALAEILRGERLIHIHSYRQDEILMFVRLSQEYGFKVATFQHILEGYKVADELASIGAGASSFADWWAYKMEVIDAIPYNGALLTRAGVVTSFNSDSNEMARRLNMEAAKAIRYGGLSEQEAWKLVTLNPAIQLGIADRVGSIQPGMDADLVLWNASPLSNYARAEQTWIDGRRYFDREQDRALQATALAERERLLNLAADARRKALALTPSTTEPAKTGKPVSPEVRYWMQTETLWWQHLAAARGLYHNGADLMSCGVNDHVH